jgi:2-dehydro-3-deoxyphosphogluconate aldolase / (4S)-4-hydroxy-2-oxoglutarate aldolase
MGRSNEVRTREQTVEAIIDCGITAVIRASSSEEALKAAQAILQGGVRIIEIAFTVPGASEVLADLRSKLGEEVVLGAGNVLTRDQALEAMGSGAEFLVAPNTNFSVLETVKTEGKVMIPGAFSPTEVIEALQAGADLIKIFPANMLGPGYLKALHGPLPGTKFVPTGGIDLANAADYIKAGAVALGVGSGLMDKKALRAGRLDLITENARKFVELVQTARVESA